VLADLTELPTENVATVPDPLPHHCATSFGPGGARFVVSGSGGGSQRVITLNHNTTVGAALEKLARHRILSAPVVIQPDLLDADNLHYERPAVAGDLEDDRIQVC